MKNAGTSLTDSYRPDVIVVTLLVIASGRAHKRPDPFLPAWGYKWFERGMGGGSVGGKVERRWERAWGGERRKEGSEVWGGGGGLKRKRGRDELGGRRTIGGAGRRGGRGWGLRKGDK